ncbi:peptidylprolyl isomerase [Roseibium sp. FZY0029]|uniref:peptidylprolyl isomerase n=1 Tax=Roseibium sp. FZY0029 TaxID=3116647 RepID=UPI002ECF9352|nr:peptidylprolyl isomerase [Roseibium sp. FZY0029]
MFRISMRRPAQALAVSLLALSLGSTVLSAAEPDDVVAKVGDTEITEADLAFAAQDLGKELQRFPPAQWRKLLLDVMVDMELMAHAAREEGLDKDPDFQRQLDFLKLRALRNAYLAQKIDGEVTDEEVQAAYDKEFADFEGAEEINARHILVKEKAEAEAIIAELDGGADFAELAREKSTGPSGPNGGSLGYFVKGQMVPPFEAAAFALEPGTYTKEPVETQFGWHVIKLEDKRRQEKPAFEEVANGLRQQLMRERYDARMAELKDQVAVEIVDESLAKAEEAGAAAEEEGAATEDGTAKTE